MKHKFERTISGEFILLKKMTLNDAPAIFRWRSSTAGQHLNKPENYSLESQINWIESRNGDEANYIIYPKRACIKVGMIGIYDVNWTDKVSNCGRLILEESLIRISNPYGVEALLLGYGYIFNVMGFRKITGTILGLNKKIFELQKFLGMRQEGYMEKHVLINGNYEDLYVMSLLAEEFPAYADKIDSVLKRFRKPSPYDYSSYRQL